MWPALIGAALILGILLVQRLTQVSAAEAKQLVADGAGLIDVRSEAEFARGHLPGAINLPLPRISQDTAGTLPGPKDKAWVLYCASGTRSALARSTLRGRGFTKVVNLGPMSKWH